MLNSKTMKPVFRVHKTGYASRRKYNRRSVANLILLALCSIPGNLLLAQKISYKGTTVLIDGQPKMLMELEYQNVYHFKSLNKKELIKITSAMRDEGGEPLYFLLFLNDKKQAAIHKTTENADCFVRYIYDNKLLVNNGIDTAMESKFIATHPLQEVIDVIDPMEEWGK